MKLKLISELNGDVGPQDSVDHLGSSLGSLAVIKQFQVRNLWVLLYLTLP